MDLSKYERLVLINQFNIRKRLERTDAYDEWIEVLENGYSIWYGDLFHLVQDDMAESDCRFVRDVLSMFRAIHYYKVDSKDPLDGEAFVEFAGFDGNEEGHLRQFACFEIHKPNCWDEQKAREQETDGFNSHMPVRDLYSRMLAVFRGTERNGAPGRLTKEQVKEILEAAPYKRAG